MNRSEPPIHVNADHTYHSSLTNRAHPASLPYIPPSSPTPYPLPHKSHRPLHLSPMDRHGHHRRRHNHRHHHAGHQVSSFNLSGCMKLPQIKNTTIKITPAGTATSSSCPPSKKNHHRGHHHFVTADPSSPKIGCMGQIKRKSKSSSSISTISSSSSSSSSFSSSSPSFSTSSSDSRSRNKLFGLKRASVARTGGSQESSRVGNERGGVPVVVSVADLDPPLPVVRKPPVSDGNSLSLWERRCGGEALTGLQLEQPGLYLYATVL